MSEKGDVKQPPAPGGRQPAQPSAPPKDATPQQPIQFKPVGTRGRAFSEDRPTRKS